MNENVREHATAKAFVSVAQRYCALLEHPVRDRDLWLADLLTTLAAVYAAAPVFREVAATVEDSPDSQDIPQTFKLTNDEWTALYTHLQKTLGPLGVYAHHFNPMTAREGDEMTGGDLADDLADIYRDLKPGLTAWNTEDGRFLPDIVHQWLEFGYRHHWGNHATAALRALHFIVHG